VISDPSTGLPPPVRGLLQVAFEALRTRLDLAAVELEIQLLLLVRLLAWFLGALACALLGLLCAATALIVALWNTHRMLGLLGGSAAFLALAALSATSAAHAAPRIRADRCLTGTAGRGRAPGRRRAVSRMRTLEARRRQLIARCEVEREELGERIEQLKESPLSRAAGELFAAPREGAVAALARPLTWAVALAGLLLLRRPRQILTLLGWARTALAFGSRAALALRLLEQLRTAKRGARDRAG
jgi:uncharacterized membrane protein YqjE